MDINKPLRPRQEQDWPCIWLSHGLQTVGIQDQFVEKKIARKTVSKSAQDIKKHFQPPLQNHISKDKRWRKKRFMLSLPNRFRYGPWYEHLSRTGSNGHFRIFISFVALFVKTLSDFPKKSHFWIWNPEIQKDRYYRNKRVLATHTVYRRIQGKLLTCLTYLSHNHSKSFLNCGIIILTLLQFQENCQKSICDQIIFEIVFNNYLYSFSSTNQVHWVPGFCQYQIQLCVEELWDILSQFDFGRQILKQDLVKFFKTQV